MSENNGNSQESNPHNQNTSKTLITAGVLGFLVVSILLVLIAGIGVVVYSFRTIQQGPESSLTIDATESQKVTPDTAIAQFVYNQEGKDADELNKKADEAIEKITQYLNKQGINDEQIVTNKSTYPNYRYQPDGAYEDAGLTSDTSFEVTFRDIQSDPTKANTVLDGLTDLGVNRFYGFRYTIDDSEDICQKLENKAIEKAYNNARQRVDALGGGKIISRDVQPMSGTCGQGYAYPMMAVDSNVKAEGSDSTTKAPKLSPGQQELSATVSVKVIYR